MATSGRDRKVIRIERLERAQKETNQRLGRLEAVQRDANHPLARIEQTLSLSSRLFGLMHERLEHLEEGQRALVEGQRALVEGQKAIVERLDRLVEMGLRDRAEWAARILKIEKRLDALERARKRD